MFGGTRSKLMHDRPGIYTVKDRSSSPSRSMYHGTALEIKRTQHVARQAVDDGSVLETSTMPHLSLLSFWHPASRRIVGRDGHRIPKAMPRVS